MPPKTLEATLLPDGVLVLEFAPGSTDVSATANRRQQAIFRQYHAEPNTWLLHLGLQKLPAGLSPSLTYWQAFAAHFVTALSRLPDLEAQRQDIVVPPPSADQLEALVTAAPPMAGSEYLSSHLLEDHWHRLNHIFALLIADWEDTLEEFFKKYSPQTHLVGRVFFHLVENAKGDAPFAFMATYAAAPDSAARHLPLRHALQQYTDDQPTLLHLLSTVHTGARQSPLLADLLDSGELFHPLAWTGEQAYAFLKDIPIYENAGILCRIPDWWTAKSAQPRLEISIGDKGPSRVGMDAILNAQPRLFLGDVELSAAEADQLLSAAEGLAFLKNRWVAVDSDKLQQALALLKQTNQQLDQQDLTLREALRLQLRPDEFLGGNTAGVEVEVTNGTWLDGLTQKLQNPNQITKLSPPATFIAQLRPYQQQGVNWLGLLDSLHLGACLADDMGLGKTVQILAFLNAIRKKGRTSLLVIPASLIANWRAELERFAPDLQFFIAHPGAHKNQPVKKPGKSTLTKLDLVITTYALAQRYAWIGEIAWDYLVLDEAQAIKNPAAKQTRAIKKLPARNRLILTGTPVENRLGDLWSLFDFLNPGLLGTATEFKRFSKTLKDNPEGYARLRRLISPYILRRLKTDKNVISDLPEKIELKTFTDLSKKQVVLYEDLIEEIQAKLESAEGIQRRGLILSSLMKFKQLCNHPDQYLGSGAFSAADSGKFGRLGEICETVLAKRERVLVFTQFREMTQPLSAFLATVFDRDGLVLHGSVPVAKRKDLIEHFQQNDEYVPFMVLSLKAGGVGLNLTQANHVIHFDRWWNPAVENQATDRAFRIGQQKNVLVHKFICRGTIEERIDAMLTDKKALFEQVIESSSEQWITEMDNQELMDIFRLKL